ncbi:sensor histidine kinase [Salinibacterium soli]|uniref:histidine kinase n=1 Tax=Antiquaquibacter soli TaxID=3064523 RepID=A0ABT9BKI5_9MICO|nr:ATP-binding protein [Protaetiibacter sp. WY-16]MDO7880943.1 ATP-binding protein [Protaetiibacter sp. WY-16]
MTRRLTLRRTLVIGIAALLAAVTVVIGVASVLALRGFLVDRLDDQLTAATGRSENAFDQGAGQGEDPGSRPPATQLLGVPGQREGTLAGVVAGGVVYNAAVISESGEFQTVDPSELQGLIGLQVGGEPATVNLGSLGDYRVVIREVGPAGDALLVGLPLAEVEATALQLTLLIAGIGVLGVAGAAAAGAVVVRVALRPLERVAAAATRVAELPLDRGEVALAVRVEDADADPATEAGKVGAAFNVMLEHVSSALSARQASENKVRTFVADASHELRTPLASIRGYAELTRRAHSDLPDDVAHAIGRVESESVRMTALVEDLLLLARLDEGAALEGTEVDLTRILVDAVSDAQAAGPQHEWHLDLPEEPVTVRGDRSRLHQVVVNLLANARTHTPAGTVVTASLGRRGADAVLEVRDTGPGIDPGLVPTIFERFVRGDSSRARAGGASGLGSTGLGLAIVSAVVEAHGGRAEVESEPGQTVFRVILPA